jgi:DNA modification methylase/superfamily II DNA or RNA helicase
MSTYQEFLSSKRTFIRPIGRIINKNDINPILFDFQKDVVSWAVHKGRAAIFLDTGMGKTFVQLEWARLLSKKTLIIAPLSVARQTVREGRKIGLDVRYIRHNDEVDTDHLLFITNYEMISNIVIAQFDAVVLDESSILKALGSKTRKRLTELCKSIPYRLACTATPAPNDNVEIGNHAEFLGICTQAEMLSMFFVNANKEHTFIIDEKAYRKKGSNAAGTEWRIKHHAEIPFFEWLSSWAITMIKPSDLNYDDDGFILPELRIITHFVKADYKPDDQLFFIGLKGIKDRAQVRSNTVDDKLNELSKIINPLSSDQWIIWTGLDKESTAVKNVLHGAIEVKGDDEPEYKAKAFEDFQDGNIKILVTKPRIGGFGMNFQNAHNMVFFGLNDSWETWYQCIRREWRYGQVNPVNVYVILSSLEEAVYENIKRKDLMAARLRTGLIEQIKKYELGELKMIEPTFSDYKEKTIKGGNWTAMLGDSALRLKEIDSNSIHLSVYSPPFADLYTYTDSEHDLGNSRNSEEFFRHYQFIITEILRVTKPGRLTCVHVSDIPAMAQKDGYIGIKDFPGDVIRAYEQYGWVFSGRAFVQKNPQAQAIRTKAKALLFVQLRKDSTDSRPALIDQILLFKKPGENEIPVNPVANGDMDNEKWIEWANGIWLGIHETDTLQYTKARDTDDEKHICPLQLGTIERCIKLYSNPGEIVLTPFMGIGSEIYQAIKFNRSGIGIELKESYFEVAVKNLKEIESRALSLFPLFQNLNVSDIEQP